jgi:glycosyltransferase involved in cell wall biosynthesis
MFLVEVKQNLTRFVKLFLLNNVDRVLLLGKIDKDRVNNLNMKIQYDVIKNGVSSIKSDVTIVRSNIIVFGGGLGNQHSGLQFLETAIKLLGKNVNLVICGTNARHQNHALYHGELDRDRFHSLVSYARIVVIPSEYESFSMVALESLSLGVPIIVSENCGISRYLTDEIDCLKVRYGDAESLGQKINRLMSNDELWSRLSYNGLLTAEKFLWENIIPEYVDIYKKISMKE